MDAPFHQACGACRSTEMGEMSQPRSFSDVHSRLEQGVQR